MNKALFLQKLKNKAPTILSIIASIGVVTTSVLTAKATVKYINFMKEKNEESESITKKPCKYYIPSIISGIITISCIMGSNSINKKIQVSLLGAYLALEESYNNYKKKTIDIYGEDGHKKIITNIAKEKVNDRNNDNKQLFFDMFSGRYIECTMEDLLRAEYETNHIVMVDGAMCANEFYMMLGLEPLDEYDILGWSAAMTYDIVWTPWIEFKHTKVELEDGLECMFIEMSPEPFPDFLEY